MVVLHPALEMAAVLSVVEMVMVATVKVVLVLRRTAAVLSAVEMVMVTAVKVVLVLQLAVTVVS